MISYCKGMKLKRMGIKKWVVFLVAELIVLGVGGIVISKDRLLPGVKVAGLNIGGMTTSEAEAVLERTGQGLGKNTVLVKYDGVGIRKSFDELGVSFNPQETLRRVYWGTVLMEEGGNWKNKFKRMFYGSGWVVYGNQKTEEAVGDISETIDIPAANSSLSVVTRGNGQVVEVWAGSGGRQGGRYRLRKMIFDAAAEAGGGELPAPVADINPQLSDEEVAMNKTRANNLLKSKIIINFEKSEWILDGEILVSFIAFPFGYDELKIGEWVATLSQTANREPQNALFVFENGRVNAFKPARNGVELRRQELISELTENLETLELVAGEAIVALPVTQLKPQITTDQVNDLGIKELIGVGKSKFGGSIPNRVHNLALASSRLNGTLVKPGEIFSFNKAVGEISKTTGYKEAYVIEKGRTVLGDGGGVCQVSSTMFRSVLNAGLLVEERKAHAFRVHYYEEDSKPGYDATVFAPSVDFKFKNDTPGYILVQTGVDKKDMSMVIELYGTSDGRGATISDPKIYSQTPPPPDLYQDDPTLPVGTVKQVDWKAWGARVSFSYKVEKGGEVIIDRVFTSNYRAWQAVYLRGTKI